MDATLIGIEANRRIEKMDATHIEANRKDGCHTNSIEANRKDGCHTNTIEANRKDGCHHRGE